MTVYLLWEFDSMASNWGSYDLSAVYAKEEDAHAAREASNARLRAASPNNKYPSLAYVVPMEVK